MNHIILAIIIGLLFGFVLQKVGASNPERIVQMLRLKDLHLMKAILLAIGLSSLTLFLFMTLGIIDNAHLDVKDAYIGVIVGGAILGLGWAMVGFCPGTGLVAAGEGRKDAWVFILGGLVGAFVFTLLYGYLEPTFLFDKIAGGKTTLADTEIDKYLNLTPALPAIVVVSLISSFLMVVSWVLPDGNEPVQGKAKTTKKATKSKKAKK